MHVYSLNLENSVKGDLKYLIDRMCTKSGILLIDDFDHYFTELGSTDSDKKDKTETSNNTETNSESESESDDKDSKYKRRQRKHKDKEKKQEFIVMNSQLEVFSGLAFGGVAMFSSNYDNAKPLDDERKFKMLQSLCPYDELIFDYIK